MRLSMFIRSQSEQILAAWDEFAATVAHPGKDLDPHALRDHAGQILLAIADELEQLTRFDEAIDQAVAESVACYTEQVQRYTNLFMGMLGHDIRNPQGEGTTFTARLPRHRNAGVVSDTPA